jgi:hypothetical protein
MEANSRPNTILCNNRPRPVQYFTPEYLARCKKMEKEQILAFLEEFALLQQARNITQSDPNEVTP